MNEYRYRDMTIGMKAGFDIRVTEKMQEQFMEMSGDANPMHIDGDYARQKGYKDRLVYGMCVASFYSQLIGMYLPGKYCLFRELNNVQWPNPVYVGDILSVFGEVTNMDDRLNTIMIKAYIKNQNGKKVSRAAIVCGVLEE